MTEEKRVQFDNKDIRKRKRGEWVDKNWQYILEGWTVTFVFLIFSAAVYSIGLKEKVFNLSFFLNAVVIIGVVLFAVLIFVFLALMSLSKNKSDLFYFCFAISLNFFIWIYLFLFKYTIFLIIAIFIDAMIGIYYSKLRIDEQIVTKNIFTNFNYIGRILSVLIPALTTIIASVLKK